LYEKQKAAKGNPGRWHGRATFGTGRAKLLTWGRYIFVSESSYFYSESAPNPFLLLQDSVHQIFIPEI